MTLTPDERSAFLSWLRERYEEMKPDAASIKEEEPDLLPAIKKLLKDRDLRELK